MRKIVKHSTKQHGGARPGTGGKRPGAGRPPLVSQEERSAIERAKSDGRSALPEILAIQKTIALDPEKYGVSACQRSADFVANRCGLPAEQKISGSDDGKAVLAIVASFARPLPSDDDPDDAAPES